MKQEIRIILKHKSDFLFLVRIIKCGNSFKVLGAQGDKDLTHLYKGHKELLKRVKNAQGFRPFYLGGALFQITPWNCNELRFLAKYKNIKSNDKVIIIDNAILKARSNEDINLELLIADYRKGNSIDFKHIKNYRIVYFINMLGYFLIAAFPKPGEGRRLLKRMHLNGWI